MAVDQTRSEEMAACGVWWHKWSRIILVLALLVLMVIAYLQHRKLANEYRLRNALMGVAQNSSTAFVLVDHHGKVTTWSKGAEEMFGLSAEQAIGGTMDPMIPARMRARHRQAFAVAVHRGGVKGETVQINCKALNKWSKEVQVVITIRSVQADRGQPMFLAEINHAAKVHTADLIEIPGDGT